MEKRSTINLPSADEPVAIYAEWRLGANTPQFANFQPWIQLNVETPNADSLKINPLIRCGVR